MVVEVVEEVEVLLVVLLAVVLEVVLEVVLVEPSLTGPDLRNWAWPNVSGGSRKWVWLIGVRWR